MRQRLTNHFPSGVNPKADPNKRPRPAGDGKETGWVIKPKTNLPGEVGEVLVRAPTIKQIISAEEEHFHQASWGGVRFVNPFQNII